MLWGLDPGSCVQKLLKFGTDDTRLIYLDTWWTLQKVWQPHWISLIRSMFTVNTVNLLLLPWVNLDLLTSTISWCPTVRAPTHHLILIVTEQHVHTYNTHFSAVRHDKCSVTQFITEALRAHRSTQLQVSHSLPEYSYHIHDKISTLC